MNADGPLGCPHLQDVTHSRGQEIIQNSVTTNPKPIVCFKRSISPATMAQHISLAPSADSQAPAYAPPNGGTRAWLTVAGCYLVYVNTYGLASAFGSYQAYYQTTLFQDYQPSTITWIGTLQLFFLGFTGVVSGPLYDRGHGLLLFVLGCASMVFALFTLSVASEFWHVVLSQGVCFGIGAYGGFRRISEDKQANGAQALVLSGCRPYRSYQQLSLPSDRLPTASLLLVPLVAESLCRLCSRKCSV